MCLLAVFEEGDECRLVGKQVTSGGERADCGLVAVTVLCEVAEGVLQPCGLVRSGQLVDGSPLKGVVSLRDALVRYGPQFMRTLTEKLLTYALGRGIAC